MKPKHWKEVHVLEFDVIADQKLLDISLVHFPRRPLHKLTECCQNLSKKQHRLLGCWIGPLQRTFIVNVWISNYNRGRTLHLNFPTNRSKHKAREEVNVHKPRGSRKRPFNIQIWRTFWSFLSDGFLEMFKDQNRTFGLAKNKGCEILDAWMFADQTDHIDAEMCKILVISSSLWNPTSVLAFFLQFVLGIKLPPK